jgi:iron complex outermembrane receptor protein
VSPAWSQAPKSSSTLNLNPVEVKSAASVEDVRSASTASKIVVTKEEIQRFGDGSVAEVLKRLPGVTTGGRPGRGGDVRMRGMGGGYTQLLVNGERMSPGFSLDDLPPDQVERIEIMRAPTAEFGARAVAGTINVVLKEALKRNLNEVRVGVSGEAGRLTPNASWTHNDKIGEAVQYTMTLSVNRHDMHDVSDSNTRWYDLNHHGAQILEQHETGITTYQREGIYLNGRVQITLAPEETLIFQPFLVTSNGTSNVLGELHQSAGDAIPQPYSSYKTYSDNQMSAVRGNVQWQKNIGDGGKWDVRGSLSNSVSDSHSLRQEFSSNDANNALSRSVNEQSSTRETGWTLTGKWLQQLENEHSLVAGMELDSSKRIQTRTTLQNGAPILQDFGDDFSASVLRTAVYMQDEWNPSKQISAYAGLRWEGIRTQSDSSNYQASNFSSVLTPLLHATWRPDEKSRNQWRASLTRSYKAATLQDLVARPSLSPLYPTGSNAASSPDRAGNPNLTPELARGFEIAYEHYLEKGGLLSANFFYRRINDLIRNTISLENVSWSTDPRWVSRPQNVGNATAQGMELEAKFRLDEIWKEALPIALRSNVSVFHSVVDTVPNPNNRLEGQPKGTANFGFDYKLRSIPVNWGANITITPGYDVQLTDAPTSQKTSIGTKMVTDMFMAWTINPSAVLRLSVNNLFPRDYSNTSSIISGSQLQDVESNNPSQTRWTLRLELKM